MRHVFCAASIISEVPGKKLPTGNIVGLEVEFYLSPAPQAEPQAAGFSAGLSPAPQAEPGDSVLFHPNSWESAMIASSFCLSEGCLPSALFIIRTIGDANKYAHFYDRVTFL